MKICIYQDGFATFEAFMVLRIQVAFICALTPCSVVLGYERFRGWNPTTTLHGVTTLKNKTWRCFWLRKFRCSNTHSKRFPVTHIFLGFHELWRLFNSSSLSIAVCLSVPIVRVPAAQCKDTWGSP